MPRYRSLDEAAREIRLLKLLPAEVKNEKKKFWRLSSNSKRQAIVNPNLPKCELIHCVLDKAPRYVALSYCWGDSGDTNEISLDGVSIPVTKSLHSALLHIRKQESTVLWVDAVCINQKDEKEKSRQVQMMRDIYRHARNVIVWLGPADPRTDEAMDYLAALGARAKACYMGENNQMQESQWEKLARMPPSYRDKGLMPDGNHAFVHVKNPQDQPSAGAPGLTFLLSDLNQIYYDISGRHDNRMLFPVPALERLFTLPWWSRIWVLQEITVADVVEFRCGNKVLDRRPLQAALRSFSALWGVIGRTIVNKHLELTAYEDAIIRAEFLPRAEFMLGLRLNFPLRPYSLIHLLRLTCIRQYADIFAGRNSFLEATDPRDKIIGLLGLAADRTEFENKGVYPNYAFSSQQLYTNTAAALFELGHMSVLSQVHFPKRQPGLPSWVPDWSHAIKQPLQEFNENDVAMPTYSASKGLTQATIVYTTDNEVDGISLSGLIHDTIHSCGKSYDEISNLPETEDHTWLRQWLGTLQDLTILRQNCYGNGGYQQEAILRTSTGDMSRTAEGRVRMTSERKFAATVVLLSSMDPANVEATGLGAVLRGMGLGSEINQQVLDHLRVYQYQGDVSYRCKERMPFITTKGHLGLGPKDIKQGDAIAILAGADVPFVLRPVSTEQFEVVGEAYVDGIMDGEAVLTATGGMRLFSLI